jgi:hypothetical protein
MSWRQGFVKINHCDRLHELDRRIAKLHTLIRWLLWGLASNLASLPTQDLRKDI